MDAEENLSAQDLEKKEMNVVKLKEAIQSLVKFPIKLEWLVLEFHYKHISSLTTHLKRHAIEGEDFVKIAQPNADYQYVISVECFMIICQKARHEFRQKIAQKWLDEYEFKISTPANKQNQPNPKKRKNNPENSKKNNKNCENSKKNNKNCEGVTSESVEKIKKGKCQIDAIEIKKNATKIPIESAQNQNNELIEQQQQQQQQSKEIENFKIDFMKNLNCPKKRKLHNICCDIDSKNNNNITNNNNNNITNNNNNNDDNNSDKKKKLKIIYTKKQENNTPILQPTQVLPRPPPPPPSPPPPPPFCSYKNTTQQPSTETKISNFSPPLPEMQNKLTPPSLSNSPSQNTYYEPFFPNRVDSRDLIERRNFSRSALEFTQEEIDLTTPMTNDDWLDWLDSDRSDRDQSPPTLFDSGNFLKSSIGLTTSQSDLRSNLTSSSEGENHGFDLASSSEGENPRSCEDSYLDLPDLAISPLPTTPPSPNPATTPCTPLALEEL